MKNTEVIWAPATLPGLSQLYSKKFELTYSDFRKELSTPFRRVQFSLILNWLSIFAVIILVKYLNNLLALTVLTISLSLLMHRVLLIIHEGAHYHLSSKRETNDYISNAFAGWFVFTDIKNYRISHIQHHRGLGSENDPENTHMEKLDLSWILAAISGFKTAKAFFRTITSGEELGQKPEGQKFIPIAGVVIHTLIIALIYFGLGIRSLIVWSISLLIVAPSLGMLRNLLEHRYVEAVDPVLWSFFTSPNGKSIEINQITTRTFTESMFSRLYGSMGFTRHLLHHWDPSISYLNLEKVHEFLLNSEVGELMKKTDTTYTRTFFYLFGR